MARIVLLEPRRQARQALRSMLRKRAGVFAVSKIHEALKAINQANPDVVIVALELGPGSDMHGLKFAKMVRGAEGGDLRKIVVYGVPAGKTPSDTKVAQLQADYEVDLYLPGNWPPQQLVLKLSILRRGGRHQPPADVGGIGQALKSKRSTPTRPTSSRFETHSRAAPSFPQR